MSSAFVFWAKDWKWAGLRTTRKIDAPFHYTIVGSSNALNLNLLGDVERNSKQKMVWQFDFDADHTMDDVVGGGIAFKFDLADYGRFLEATSSVR